MANEPHFIDNLIALAKTTGAAILDIYERSDQFAVQSKPDSSPLTQADLIAHYEILEGLKKITPDIPILSEEQNPQIDFSERKTWQHYWLVDPLDGTKEFISHSGDFAINIALIENHKPIVGLIYSPVLDEVYFAGKGYGAYRQTTDMVAPEKIHTRKWQNKTIVAVGHHYKVEKLIAILEKFGEYEIVTMGSALKFCAVAEGRVDFYPRLGQTSEWDTAAGQIIVEEAGGAVIDLDFQPLRYNTKDSLINPPFLALGSKELLERLKK